MSTGTQNEISNKCKLSNLKDNLKSPNLCMQQFQKDEQ